MVSCSFLCILGGGKGNRPLICYGYGHDLPIYLMVALALFPCTFLGAVTLQHSVATHSVYPALLFFSSHSLMDCVWPGYAHFWCDLTA